MKRLISLIFIILFLIPFIPRVSGAPLLAKYGPTTVGQSFDQTFFPLGPSIHRQSCYQSNNLFVFWKNTTNLVYSFQPDSASSWTTTTVSTSLGGNFDGFDFSIWCDGTFIYYEIGENLTRGDAMLYARGTTQTSGAITWTTEVNAIPGKANFNFHNGQIAVDTSGHAMIVYANNTGTTPNNLDTAWVTKNSATDGTWSTATGFPVKLSATTDPVYWGNIVPLPSNEMYLFDYTIATGKGQYGSLYDGTTIHSQVLIENIVGTLPGNPTAMSVVSLSSGNIYGVFTDYSILRWKRYTFSNDTWSILHGFNQAVVGEPPSITKDANEQYLYASTISVSSQKMVMFNVTAQAWTNQPQVTTMDSVFDNTREISTYVTTSQCMISGSIAKDCLYDGWFQSNQASTAYLPRILTVWDNTPIKAVTANYSQASFFYLSLFGLVAIAAYLFPFLDKLSGFKGGNSIGNRNGQRVYYTEEQFKKDVKQRTWIVVIFLVIGAIVAGFTAYFLAIGA